MKTVDYQDGLYERLQDQDYAAEYLAEVLATESYSTFLLALRDVIEAKSLGIGELADEIGVTRQALHKIMSENGNPRLSTLNKLLHATGFQISIKSLESQTI
ncbi:helix-turn-helix domain-containing transcriptional regulator [Candidatus Entotheonella palauensis]|uniref:HTH cro/C1-type domain-containing protein n=1 Tax=Candidatus Entotheonella gemina TaxID=1429439 RepID=W4L7L9_9BACT|nr:helix-turn-helix domain-containing protein [Candidatus Entotheonella palauensis]ETW94073.1 MAG: hypothetical protein ETSY2_50375 [Candidatus Entotheonella gemina]